MFSISVAAGWHSFFSGIADDVNCNAAVSARKRERLSLVANRRHLEQLDRHVVFQATGQTRPSGIADVSGARGTAGRAFLRGRCRH